MSTFLFPVVPSTCLLGFEGEAMGSSNARQLPPGGGCCLTA